MLSLINCALLASAPTLEVPAALELTHLDTKEPTISAPRDAIKMGLAWLARHQNPNGYWNHKEFWKDNRAGGTQCVQGAGTHVQHVGSTGLALLALVGDKRSLKQMEKVALQAQCKEKNDYQGSWDPLGAWGYSGGRIYSTALMLLILEEIAG